MDNQQSLISKCSQIIKKNQFLIEQCKFYEFAEKMKLLAHRKMQTSKLKQAELIYSLSAQKLLLLQNVDDHIAFDILHHLVEFYQRYPELWSEAAINNIQQILTIRKKTTNRFYIQIQILNKISKPKQVPILTDDLLTYYEDNQEFVKAEPLVLDLNLERIQVFMQKWKNYVKQEEMNAIQCRLALMRGLVSKKNFQECYKLLNQVSNDNQFYKFAHFLISAARIQSKEAYEKIGVSYAKFLESDTIYTKIYEVYGKEFLKCEKSKSGLDSLLKTID